MANKLVDSFFLNGHGGETPGQESAGQMLFFPKRDSNASVDDSFFENDVDETIWGAASPSPARRAVRRRMRTVSRSGAGAATKTPVACSSPSHKVCALMDRVVSKAADNFPMAEAAAELPIHGLYMGFTAVRWFRFGTTATFFALRLAVFALLLLPVFMQLVYVYFRSKRIRRRIRFGPNMRNFCDIYCPPEALAAARGEGPKVPVVIGVMGGAWVIGHRAWNMQLGLRLTDIAVLFVAIDYRNFPVGHVSDMVEDVSRGIQWTFANIAAYGGDPENVALIGQSAGAHLSALLLLEHSLVEAKGARCKSYGNDGDMAAGCQVDSWSVSDLKGCFLVSGPYDLVDLEPHLDSRGLYSRILRHFCDGGDLAGSSPAHIFDSEEWQNLGASAAVRLPPLHLLHGMCDKTVPVRSTTQFASSLRKAGVKSVEVELLEGVAHAEIVVEGPMKGEEYQIRPLMPFIFGKDWRVHFEQLPKLAPMYPRPIIELASWVMPF